MPENTWINFKDMCARFDVTPRTLRYYEYIELLSPRREGRARWYGPREIARMKLIMRGRRFGFSLEEIRQWLLIYQQQGTRAQYEVWVEFATRQLDVLKAQRAEIEASITDLQDLRDETVRLLAEMPEGGDRPAEGRG
ncbi:MerR family DNA-binding transcriptional regulator [Paracoccus sp. (in: a-proteobacteria)]|uniref:MerR family transcriptional regulator n=1 Tax=Paracoccus sp. TaxID=267 RepID=UPI0026DFDB38|nr:MerR family DNA-binding transcriptional regulator [Paracoccus sp. (in: a-proteobacteria)]MDO5369220.1 MerR family DNA-binding transcriptional regulator [Paracoccus sp. (in: a-proteobacteria)]